MATRRNRRKWVWGLFVCLSAIVLTGCGLATFLMDSGFVVDGSKKTDPEIAETEDPELFQTYYGKAEELLATLSLEEKVGQLFLARMPVSDASLEIERFKPGGYILFAVNFRNESPTTINQRLSEYQGLAKVKMIFGVDEEGGSVVRVSQYPAFRAEKFRSPQELWMRGGAELIKQDTIEKAELLKSIQINMNLAPVADVTTNPEAFMYERSLGQCAEETATYVEDVVATMRAEGLISVIKHFPGYGENVDTHTGIAVDERPYRQFEEVDFLPFLSGIEAGGPAILMSHDIILAMSGELPASLSPQVHEVLRNKLRFSGVIMTDDLAMEAVKSYVEDGRAAVLALLAGNDLIITSDLVGHYMEVLTAVQQGEISEAQIDKAVKRVLALKYAYGIIDDNEKI